jgi:hypothetical protein
MGSRGAALAGAGPRAGLTAAPGEGDRAALWLPLLRRLTTRFPRWAVWKNVDSALTAVGDVDSLAPREDWPAIEDEFRAWAAANGLTHGVVCRHIPQGPHLLAFGPGTRHFLQLDLKERATFRGSTLVDVPRLLAVCDVDERGIRRARAGAEGVIKLASNGLRPGGRPDPAALAAKHVAALLAADPEGVRQASAWFGPAAGALRALATAVAAGGWDRGAALAVEAWALARGLAEPRTLLGRTWLKYHTRARCPVIQTIRRENRRLPDDLAGWVAAARATHPGAVW